MRQEDFLTDWTGLGVPFPLMRAVTGMVAEPAMTSECLAAVIAGPAGLFGIAGGPPPARLAAKNHVAARLGRYRSVAPQAFPVLPHRNSLGTGLGGIGRLLAFLAAIHAVCG